MNDEYAIAAAKTEFREAYNRGDVDRLLSVFCDQGFTDMSEGEPSFYGSEASAVLRRRMKKFFAEFDVEMAIIIINIELSGNVAYDYGWHKLVCRPKRGGAPVHSRYRYFEKWVRQADGKWKIAFQITNRDVPPAMPPPGGDD
jgi:ketosteroid isomerase-like protein